MNFIKTKIPDVIIIEPKIYGDHRGYFFESFNLKTFNEKVIKTDFVQDNESKSSRGVLRGLHFQKPPYAQAKLVRCIKGCVLDVAVDIRVGSPTYGQHVTVELSEDNKRQLFVPRGFAHGYSVLSEEAIFAYKVDNWYKPEYDSGIIWNDTDLGIDWQLENDSIKLSEKDSNLLVFKDLKSSFNY
ncbi:dTDP-4-dehydrorhamnose 3,5-epimerase [Tenacibaculum sp. C7A-26P2]|uniref:dTDP-4-dehydrorhamnose 3,5-epimerase n=1 Tax=Tenacibaculum sp. C7A-26P2 TaxID=3447504 RepID=UPI003F83044C